MLAVSGEPAVREPRLIHAKKALDGAYASAGLLLICCRPIIAETHYKNLMRVAHDREPQAGLQFVGMDRANSFLAQPPAGGGQAAATRVIMVAVTFRSRAESLHSYLSQVI